MRLNLIWRLPSQSELTQMIFIMELTHLGSEASKSVLRKMNNKDLVLNIWDNIWYNYQSQLCHLRRICDV